MDHLKELISNAMGNEEFKQKLLANLKESFESVGIILPGAVDVELSAKSDNSVHVVIKSISVETEHGHGHGGKCTPPW